MASRSSSCSTSPTPISTRWARKRCSQRSTGLKQDGVTVVIVAHRPSILAGVDKILALRTDGSCRCFRPARGSDAQFTAPRQPAAQQPSAIARQCGDPARHARSWGEIVTDQVQPAPPQSALRFTPRFWSALWNSPWMARARNSSFPKTSRSTPTRLSIF